MGGHEETSLLRFAYCNAKGETARHELQRWQEEGKYIVGFNSAGQWLKFLKERVIEYLDDAQAWLNSPYPQRAPLPKRDAPKDDRPQVAFTGFVSARRAELEAQADSAGLRVCKSVTQGLHYLVAGSNAGPMKVQKARMQGCWILDEEQLLNLLDTGELPDR